MAKDGRASSQVTWLCHRPPPFLPWLALQILPVESVCTSPYLNAQWNLSGNWCCGLQLVIKSSWPEIYPGATGPPVSVTLDCILHSCGCILTQYTRSSYSERCKAWGEVKNQREDRDYENVEPSSRNQGRGAERGWADSEEGKSRYVCRVEPEKNKIKWTSEVSMHCSNKQTSLVS